MPYLEEKRGARASSEPRERPLRHSSRALLDAADERSLFGGRPFRFGLCARKLRVRARCEDPVPATAAGGGAQCGTDRRRCAEGEKDERRAAICEACRTHHAHGYSARALTRHGAGKRQDGGLRAGVEACRCAARPCLLREK